MNKKGVIRRDPESWRSTKAIWGFSHIQVCLVNSALVPIIRLIGDTKLYEAKPLVNAEMIQMYWRVGEYLSMLCTNAAFGDKIVDDVAAYIVKENPGAKGFNRRGLYRMKQSYIFMENS